MYSWETGTTWIGAILGGLGGIGAIYRFGPVIVRFLFTFKENLSLKQDVTFLEKKEVAYQAWIAVLEAKVTKLESVHASSVGLPSFPDTNPPIALPSGSTVTPKSRRVSRRSSRSSPALID